MVIQPVSEKIEDSTAHPHTLSSECRTPLAREGGGLPFWTLHCIGEKQKERALAKIAHIYVPETKRNISFRYEMVDNP